MIATWEPLDEAVAAIQDGDVEGARLSLQVALEAAGGTEDAMSRKDRETYQAAFRSLKDLAASQREGSETIV